MRIAVLGSGNVGRTLAAGLAEKGHQVVLASRTPDSAELVEWGATAGVGLATPPPAAQDAELAFLATSWPGVAETLASCGAALTGKVLVDVTNPLRFTDRLELAIGFDDSGAETVQRQAPDARVVKAFNSVGFEMMVDPQVAGGPPTMFVAGDDAEARAVAAQLSRELGWAPHDCGDLRAARLLEPLALLWIEHAIRTGHRGHAFRLLAPGTGDAG